MDKIYHKHYNYYEGPILSQDIYQTSNQLIQINTNTNESYTEEKYTKRPDGLISHTINHYDADGNLLYISGTIYKDKTKEKNK